MAQTEIAGGGGVLWRPSPGGEDVEVALVHRPRYDDWSLPKGKVMPGEHVLLGAVREVVEETGHLTVVGRPLGVQRYTRQLDSGPVPKSVRFWAMRAHDGEFAAGSEVDELAWLRPSVARATVTLDRDRTTLDEFGAESPQTVAVALVRHASAAERAKWTGDDHARPLDRTGIEQAESLRPVLGCYGLTRVGSADVLRCIDTVAPYAAEHRLPVESEPLLSESAYAANPQAGFERTLEILTSGRPTAVCSQGRVLPDLVARVCRHFGVPPPAEPAVPKGWLWVLHMAGERLVTLERLTPPVATPG